MSRPYQASNPCDDCGESAAVAWMLEDEQGRIEATVFRCMFCKSWEFTYYTEDGHGIDFYFDGE